ncbi:hypothetical protein [Ancylobacter sp. TS-1]|uniref:hypothetical protein n=1 Tax=Ancylobacter sp. TS-1 TaxID=1850374 RepID=UPI001265C4EF|nr:hypothetical protein [Ancylobacter sp. TS-1]QFR31900.1 hypothetical protein GBB76_01525 [Ancylobacter sp. TS-1]
MNPSASERAEASIIVPGAADGAGIVATVRALLGQSVAVEVIAVCDADGARALQDAPQLGGSPLLVIVPVPSGSPLAEQVVAGWEQVRGTYLGVVCAGTRLHPRHVELMLAAAGEQPSAGGVCIRDPASAALPGSWVRPDAVRLQGFAPLLAGTLVAESLLARVTTLRACGGPLADSGEGCLFDLAFRLAMEAGLGPVDLPALTRPTFHVPPMDAAGSDALLARRLAEAAERGRLETPVLFELHAATRSWPLTHRAACEAVDAAVARLSVAVGVLGVPPGGADGRGIERSGVRLVPLGRRTSPLDALKSLAEQAPGTDYLLLAEMAPPDSDSLAGLLLRSEAAGMDACLPVADDGLLHPAPAKGLIVGTLFRARTLAGVLASGGFADELGFWARFARVGVIDALDIAAPTPLAAGEGAFVLLAPHNGMGVETARRKRGRLRRFMRRWTSAKAYREAFGRLAHACRRGFSRHARKGGH